MFDVYCPRHGTRVLLGSRSIESVVNTVDGITVQWRCRCGATGTLTTGRPHPRVSAAHADTLESAAPAA
jgi:hypothetical protein